MKKEITNTKTQIDTLIDKIINKVIKEYDIFKKDMLLKTSYSLITLLIILRSEEHTSEL